MTDDPDAATTISVIIPAYNSADTLQSCIESALQQECAGARVEVVVVDNGSTDASLEIARRYPVVCFSESKRGRSAARNAGARVATGRVLGFLDSDCVAPRGWLEAALRALGTPAVGAVQARIRKHGKEAPPTAFVQGYYYAPFLDTAALVTPREAFENARGFDEGLRRNVDIDFTFRLLACGYALAWTPEIVVVKYHYLNPGQAWHRGIEGGEAGSRLEAKWHELVGHKSRRRRYTERLLGTTKAMLRAAFDPEAPFVVVTGEHVAKLVAYFWEEAFGATIAPDRYDSATPLPSVLGARRFLVMTGARALIFDAAQETSTHLDADETRRLLASIDDANPEGRSALVAPLES